MPTGSRIRADPPQQLPCLASLYPAAALPKLGLEQLAMDVQEADGDLVQRSTVTKPQVPLPEFSCTTRRVGWPRATAASLCPWGGFEPSVGPPGKGVSVRQHLLGNSWDWDELRLSRAAGGSGTSRRVVLGSPSHHSLLPARGPSPTLSLLFLLSPRQALSTELQAAGREQRSPRRCIRLLESCLGQQFPCCDPCATCYCRFFNAVCYCRKISSGSSCGKN